MEGQLHSTVKPLYLVSTVFGLVPISPFIREAKLENIKLKWLYMFWPFTWILVLTGLLSFEMCCNIDSHLELPKTMALSAMAYIVLAYFTCVITLIHNIVQRRKFPMILSELGNIDKTLMPITGINIYKRERSYLIKNLVVFCAALIILEVCFCLEENTGSYTNVLSLVLQSAPFIINTLTLLQFKTWVRKIYERLYTVNFIITRHTKEETTAHKNMLTSSKIVNYIEKLATETRILPLDIQKLRCVYIQLYDSKEMVVNLYGIPIVCQVLTAYFLSVGALYWGIKAVVGNYNQLTAALYFLLGAYTLLMLFWNLLHCQLASSEAHKIVVNIQKMVVKRHFPLLVEQNIMKMVTQIRDMPIDFSPCGLFTFNLPFMCSTIGVICTYTVILVQLKD